MPRVLVAHNVPRARTGGMSRLMGFHHDRVAAAGFEVAEFAAEDAPSWARGRQARLGFPVAVYKHARAELKAGRRYDLINVHEPVAAAAVAGRARLGRPVVVVTSHGIEERAWELALEELKLGRSGPSRKTRLVYPATVLAPARYALRRADHLFCLNRDDAEYARTHYRRAAGDITVVRPGADPVFAEAAAGRSYAGADRLLFAGTWRKNKGIEDLVPAFAELAAARPGLRLTVLGAGYPPEAVLAAFPEALRGRVAVVRAASEAETAAAFAAADVLVLPSLFEGTPLVLAEAMRSGLPLVTTATCGMKDVVEHERTGLLVPIRSPELVAAAVGRLLGDAELRGRLGRAAAEVAAREYTWDAVSAPVVGAYRQLLAPEGGPSCGR